MELVLFDLDGTLVDGDGLPGAMRATCEALARSTGASADALVAANTAAWRRVWSEVEDDYMLGGRSGHDIGREVWRETLEACGLRDDDLLDRAWTAWLAHERAAVRLFPDVLPLLDDLERRGVRLGMVTNGSGSVQRAKLDAVGLLGRLDPLVVSGEVGVMKPDPAIFEIAVHAAGVPASETWFVGDNLWHDVPGAVEVGIHAVWLDRPGRGLRDDGPTPTEVVRSLDELLGDRAAEG